jgi:hypothetical protein
MTGKDLEGSVSNQIMLISWHLPAFTEEKHKELKTVGVQAKIRTDALPNTSQHRYV